MQQEKTINLTMHDVVIFKLGRQRYGLYVGQVVEVLQMVSVTELPDLPPGMLGLINYRGKVIPLIDLRQVFQTPINKIHLNTLILVAKHKNKYLSMIVDAVEGVEALHLETQTTTEELPEDVHYLSAVAKIGEDLLLVLNLESLLSKFH